MKIEYIKKAYNAVRADESLKAKILQKANKLSEAEFFLKKTKQRFKSN